MKPVTVRWMVGCAIGAAMATYALTPLAVHAQAGNTGKARQPAAKPAAPRTPVIAERPPREMTLEGRIVSVHAYMIGHTAEDDARTIIDGLRAGGAAGLDTPGGLVVLGQGNAGGIRALMPLANEQVQVHGKMYEKGGVKFLDFDSIEAVVHEEEEPEEEEGGDE